MPVKFSLHGDFGLGAVAAVTSEPIACASTAAAGEATPATGTLAYSARPDRYAFRWATDRAWLGTCRQLAITLDDGTVHRANLRFAN